MSVCVCVCRVSCFVVPSDAFFVKVFFCQPISLGMVDLNLVSWNLGNLGNLGNSGNLENLGNLGNFGSLGSFGNLESGKLETRKLVFNPFQPFSNVFGPFWQFFTVFDCFQMISFVFIRFQPFSSVFINNFFKNVFNRYASVILSATAKRFSVSRMRDVFFFKCDLQYTTLH